MTGSAALGSRRLAIIDLPSSQQPMFDAAGRYALVYNGEIYNYRELHGRTAGRWTYRTAGDTEVLLAGLVLEGPSFLAHAEGMWAFALWDSARGELLLGRDRFGKKPLYYRTWPGGIAAASELPALRILTSTRPWTEDLDSTADYFRYGFYLPGRTAYREVHELAPGCVLRWTAGQGPRQEQYWSLPLEPCGGRRSEALERLREMLTDAVKCRLVADVEVGAFLSGGLDSSLVVALMTRKLGHPTRTFSIGFADRSFDERAYARDVARRCGTRHYEEVLETFDPAQLSDLVLSHVGQPFGDSSLLPTAMVSRLAARHVKVVLSGDGGDEMFCGYQRYLGRVLLRWYSRLPQALRRGAGRAVRSLPEPMAHHSRSLLKKAHLFVDLAAGFERAAPYVAPVCYSPAELAELAPSLASAGHVPPQPAETGLDDIHRMMATDALIYLPQDILLKVDRASMAHSLEARAPFLDSRVAALALSLPASWHRSGLRGKALLREAFPDLLPASVRNRRKQGFAVPVHAWFRGSLAAPFQALVDGAPEWINRSHVLALLEEHRHGRRDHGQRLWNLYVYLRWRSLQRPASA